MKSEVLIAYCTRSGSTAEVAQSIGKAMKEAGLAVQVKSIAEVESIPAGTAVVLGTALYIGHFPKEFHQFATRLEAELAKVRPWIFVLGPTEKERKHFAAAEEQARKELGKHPSLRPADMRILGVLECGGARPRTPGKQERRRPAGRRREAIGTVVVSNRFDWHQV